jgi:hypothetical protein
MFLKEGAVGIELFPHLGILGRILFDINGHLFFIKVVLFGLTEKKNTRMAELDVAVTLSITTFSITTLSITTLSITTLSIRTLSITTLIITTLSIMGLVTTLSINGTQHNGASYNTQHKWYSA